MKENLGNELSRELQKLYLDEGRYFYKYAMELLSDEFKLKKMQPKTFFQLELSDEHLFGFQSLLRAANYPFSNVEFEQNRGDLKFLLLREMAYLGFGDEGRFYANMKLDFQLHSAIRQTIPAQELLTRGKIPAETSVKMSMQNH